MKILKRLVAKFEVGESDAPSAGETDNDPPPNPEVDLTTKPQQVVAMLDRNGGRMRQSEIVSSTEWSSATVSRVLSEMDSEGTVRKIRIGRENVISLIGSEPDWYTPPDDLSADPTGDEDADGPPILLVEDNQQDEQLLKEAFGEVGVTNPIHAVRDGSDAVEFLLQRGRFAEVSPPALVLLDLQLLMIDGFDVLAEIDAHEHLRAIPFLVLSHSDDPENMRTAYEQGATAYLTKPANFDGLLELVEAIDAFWLSQVRQPAFAGPKISQ